MLTHVEVTMAFSHSDYTFSHIMKNTADTSSPMVFSVDLTDLIRPDGHSTLFSIDTMSITAYRQGSWDKMPVKFAVLNGNKTRVITYDPTKLSSKWSVDLGLHDNTVSYKDYCDRLNVTIAGLDTEPFNRTTAIHADENKQAACNVLRFMMSQSLWAADKARGALDVVMTAQVPDYAVQCTTCRQQRVVHIRRQGEESLSFPLCTDNCVCLPLSTTSVDPGHRAVCDIMALIRCAYADKLDYLLDYTTAGVHPFNHSPYDQQGITVSYSSLRRLTGLYQALSEYADTFAVVDTKTPNIKVLFESSCNNIGLVTGSIGITTIYGSSVCDIYQELCAQHRSPYGVRGEEEEEEEEQDIISSCHGIRSQLTPEVMLRRTPLSFALTNNMELVAWPRYFFRRPASLYC